MTEKNQSALHVTSMAIPNLFLFIYNIIVINTFLLAFAIYVKRFEFESKQGRPAYALVLFIYLLFHFHMLR